MELHTSRSTASTGGREVGTEFYAAFNHLATDREGRDESAATLSDDVSWTVVTDGDGSERNYTDVEGVVEYVAMINGSADHVQTVPERVSEADDTVVVEGAYVGTDDGREFDVPFVHVHELDGETVQTCRTSTDTALEQSSFER